MIEQAMTPSKALLESVLECVTRELELKPRVIGLQPDGRPIPLAGQHYIAIHNAGFVHGGSPDQHVGNDRKIGFGIGITQRTGFAPVDRMLAAIYHNVDGVVPLYERIDRVVRKCRYEINHLAMGRLAGTEFEHVKFAEPPRLAGGSLKVRTVGPDHFSAEPCADHLRNKCQDYGVYLELTYGGVRLLEDFNVITEGISVMAIGEDFIIQ